MYLGSSQLAAPTTLIKSTTYPTSTRQNQAYVPWNCQSQV
jgi:hypothetical protein